MASLIIGVAIIVAIVIFVAALSWGSSLITAGIAAAIALIAVVAMLGGLNSGCKGKD